MSDLTAHALEAVLAEIQSSDLLLSILPTMMYLRLDVVAELARERGVSTEEMLSVIRGLVAEAGNA